MITISYRGVPIAGYFPHGGETIPGHFPKTWRVFGPYLSTSTAKHHALPHVLTDEELMRLINTSAVPYTLESDGDFFCTIELVLTRELDDAGDSFRQLYPKTQGRFGDRLDWYPDCQTFITRDDDELLSMLEAAE